MSPFHAAFVLRVCNSISY